MAKIKKANNGTTTTQTTKKRSVDDILGNAEQRAENSRKVDSIISSRIKELKNTTPKNSNEYTNTPEFRKLLSESAERSNRAAKQAAESIPTKANGGLRKNGGSMKKKMKNGGSLSGLKASNKRVGPIDPKGAFTKVQKKTLKGAKGKASLTKNKQLGATKQTAKSGAKVSKKK